MKTLNDLGDIARTVFSTNWTRRKGIVVPDVERIKLDNDAVQIDAAVLYADMAGSSLLVRDYKDYFAAEIYKAFLKAICEVVHNNDGAITSFDGDRIMAVFTGGSKCSVAAKTGLQIVSAVRRVNETLHTCYPSTSYQIDFGVGIDVSSIFAVKTGIRANNDLAWIGTAANNAARLSELRGKNERVFITQRLFESLNSTSKFGGNPSRCMWDTVSTNVISLPVLGSQWWWNF